MKKEAVLFLLGAGASVDSGLKTYRGTENRYNKFDETDDTRNPVHVSALYDEKRILDLQNHFEEIQKDIPENVGPTYLKIKEIIEQYTDYLIVTQNIDGLASKICENVVELHGSLQNQWFCLKCDKNGATRDNCLSCGGYMRPDVVLFGENVSSEKFTKISLFIKKKKPSICYVIGTSLRFNYLQNIIKKAKMKNSKIIHVNPDPEYNFHLQTLSQRYGSLGNLQTKIKKKKNPELLLKSLWDIS